MSQGASNVIICTQRNGTAERKQILQNSVMVHIFHPYISKSLLENLKVLLILFKVDLSNFDLSDMCSFKNKF